MTDTIELATLGYIISGADRSLTTDADATEGATTGAVYILSGDAVNGFSGNAVLQAGNARDGAGNAIVQGGHGTGGVNSDGGPAHLFGGNGAGDDGDGGDAKVEGGGGTGTGNGGIAELKGGTAAGSANGGDVRIGTGAADSGNAGNVTITLGLSNSGINGHFKLALDDFADDAAAATGGVPVNGWYRTASVVKVRVA